MFSPDIVTNLPEQSRGFYGGVLATVAIIAIIAREIPALMKFIKGRRNGHVRDDDTPADQLRTHASARTIDEIREIGRAHV